MRPFAGSPIVLATTIRTKETAMYSPHIHQQLIKSRIRDLNHVAPVRGARQPVITPRPRRWRLRTARPSLVARFAI
jgi:hypothetical protein